MCCSWYFMPGSQKAEQPVMTGTVWYREGTVEPKMPKALPAERTAETALHRRGIKQGRMWTGLHFIPGLSGYSRSINKMRGSAWRRLLSMLSFDLYCTARPINSQELLWRVKFESKISPRFQEFTNLSAIAWEIKGLKLMRTMF